ncbi:MAG: glycosyltransferase [Candidatus Omnitrophica bacterium]|nr:glycosyltransferase [Candidatus Omnitrophota bacterium]
MSPTVKKIKVLHLLEWCELGGGLEIMTKEIVCGLDKEKFEVEVWCLYRGGLMAEEIHQQGLPVRVLNISTYHNPCNILKLIYLFKEARPDIIHTHVYFASTIGRIAAKLAGVKVCINHVHSSYWHYSKWNLMIERVLSVWTEKIICVSQSVRDFVVQYEKIPSSKVLVIYNGITRKEINSQPNHDFIVTIVASLFANKGHRVLLEAIASLKNKHPSLKCWMVGEGQEGLGLRALCEELGIVDRVVFWGVRWDIPEILAQSQLFVLTSTQREGLGVAILEAMAYGLPVIASRVGGIPEIIEDGKNGCLVPPGDSQKLAECIDRLIQNTDERQRLASAGRQTFEERFQAKYMIEKIQELYLSAI